VNAEDLRRFARRDWAAVAALKRDYWTEQYRQHGPGPARAAATALLLHVQAVQPDYPSAQHRDEDLANHRALRQRLDRAAHAFPRR
jgi:hypothetical protein